MSTVLITGGTGLIGTAITRELVNKGYTVIVLTRFPGKYSQMSRLSYAGWDITNQLIDSSAIVKADHIIHLAGAGLADKRWSRKRKEEIVDSRTRSSKLIAKALSENANRVKSVISASAIGWYGSSSQVSNNKGTGENPFNETDPASPDFLGTACKEWEEGIDPVLSLGKRLVKFRTGIVLSNEGGALVEFKRPMRFGVATILATGKQIVSWIHIEDLVRLYVYAIENNELKGVYNAVAPHPVTNRNLVLELARELRGKFFVPVFVPSFILKIVLGELSIEVLKSASVSSEKIKGTGFTFLYPSIRSAIQKLSVS